MLVLFLTCNHFNIQPVVHTIRAFEILFLIAILPLSLSTANQPRRPSEDID